MGTTATQSLAQRLAARCAADGEFRLAARYWDGSLSIDLDRERIDFMLRDGHLTLSGTPPVGAAGAITLRAPASVWDQVLAPVPQPFFNDIMPARAFGLELGGDTETFWQYYPAVRRLIDLLREEVHTSAATL